MKYSEELKATVVDHYHQKNEKVSELSKKYKVPSRRIYEWLSISRINGNRVDNSTIDIMQVKLLNNSIDSKEIIEKKITSTSNEEELISDILFKNGLSPDEWQVTNVSVNTWNHLSGKTNHQTKLTLIKKQIALDLEVPAPLKINISNYNNKLTTKPTKKLKCAVILPDMQVGFKRNINNGSMVAIHDRSAMQVANKIIEYIKPDRVVLLGDNLDLAELSTKYTTPADMMFTTQASIVELGWWLGKIRSIDKNMTIDYIAGNHESRIDRFISEKASMLSGLKQSSNLSGKSILSIENLLDLDSLNIKYYGYPQGMVALNSNLVCIHGEVAKGMSGATVTELVKSARVSVIQGHIHRHEVATKTVWDAYDNYHIYTAASFGCLCKIDPGFVPGMKYRQNWQNGIGVVWYEEGGLEQFQMTFVPIIAGRAIYEGSVFDSDDEKEIAINIEKDTQYRLT